jgi:hypothetical protein
VHIQYEAARFLLRVRDDGKGIAQETIDRQPSTGHFGLHGMRERAEIIGGRLDVWSKVGSGTAVDLSVPANVAYCSPSKWSWIFPQFSKHHPVHGKRQGKHTIDRFNRSGFAALPLSLR